MLDRAVSDDEKWAILLNLVKEAVQSDQNDARIKPHRKALDTTIIAQPSSIYMICKWTRLYQNESNKQKKWLIHIFNTYVILKIVLRFRF